MGLEAQKFEKSIDFVPVLIGNRVPVLQSQGGKGFVLLNWDLVNDGNILHHSLNVFFIGDQQGI